ncbi:MAG: D-tyrosyl-tRNA(Tyr) deacylase, partial [Firmicutes bacterium]|nr:D-tyrosyl-tRNA(Tyr) deacylase [Bacillota bacterium]
MTALIQRVSSASVQIDGKIKASIQKGLLIFLGVRSGDDGKEAGMLARKTAALRIFNDSAEKINLSVTDISAEAMVLSQFTLCADTRKGNRPSFINAAQPDKAAPLYEEFVLQLRNIIGAGRVQTGEFGADMKVELINDGPVTI